MNTSLLHKGYMSQSYPILNGLVVEKYSSYVSYDVQLQCDIIREVLWLEEEA